MTRENATPTRRALLSAVGTGLAAGAVGTRRSAAERGASQYVLVQGDRCVPVRPIRGQLSAETFYEYQLPEKYASDANGASVGNTAQYASAGTTDIQRPQTSIAFLYQGPRGVSLVVIHGSVGADDGGSVTFRLSGLPADGRWVVKDDRYRDPETGNIAPSNYDNWGVGGDTHRIDWTWGSGGTDGGVFRGLGGAFAVTIEPAFNDAAALYGDHYEGTVTDWEFLSGSAGVSDRIALDMTEPLRIATGECDGETRERADGDDGDRSEDREDGDEDNREDRDEDEREEDGEGYLVCHRPPGNPDNAHTIRVGSEAALRAHLDHGDSRGRCSDGE